MLGVGRHAEDLLSTGVMLTVFGIAMAGRASMRDDPPEAAVVAPVAAVEAVRWVDVSAMVPPVVVPEAVAEPVAVARTAAVEGALRARPLTPASAPAAVATPPRADATEPAAPRARRHRCTTPSDPAIAASGEGSWTVNRSVVHRYTRDWSRLGELGWSRVHEDPTGRADGFEIGGVRCGSDLWDAGVRNGDVVHSVNGRAVRSVTQAVWAYGALRGEDDLSVRITRKGESRVLRYRLVD
jgi:hypothetical protein